MTNNDKDQNVSRRSFLKAATITAVAATATGAGAAILTNNTPIGPMGPTEPVTPLTSAAQTTTNLTPHAATDELFARLATTQAENVRLQAALDAARRQINARQQANSDSSLAAETVTLELDAANEQITILSGLVALYEQLDEVDVEAALGAGLAAVSHTITELLDQAPTLAEGIEVGRLALATIEGQIPVIANGRSWLKAHLNQLQIAFRAIETILATAVDAVGPMLQMIDAWFQEVRKWLPFNFGQRATEIMQTITHLLGQTPHTISGLDTNIAQPLALWLGEESEEAPLQKDLIEPLRAQVLDKAGATIAKAQQVKSTYQTHLEEPTLMAVNHQRIIRDLIVEYRQQHHI